MNLPKRCALKTFATAWNFIPWDKVKRIVRSLQRRIAKTISEGSRNKARALQWVLTHSYSAKLLAVKRVTENKGKNTPGVDGVLWKSPTQKLKAAKSLSRKGYTIKPLRRVYIKKKNGKERPLGIPTMNDRTMQALFLSALDPV
jgi:RNA-directed DNA polymerase